MPKRRRVAVPGERVNGVKRCRWRHGAVVAAALVLALALAMPAAAARIETFDHAYGSATAIGPGSYSPEITSGVLNITYFGGVDATGAALAATTAIGDPSDVFPGGRLDLAPAVGGAERARVPHVVRRLAGMGERSA